MSGAVVDTIKGAALILHVVEDGDGFAVSARYGPPEWLASRDDMGKAF